MGGFTPLQIRDMESEFRLTQEMENVKKKILFTVVRELRSVRGSPESVLLPPKLKKSQFVTRCVKYSLGNGNGNVRVR